MGEAGTETVTRLRDTIRNVAPDWHVETWLVSERYRQQMATPRFLGTLVTGSAVLSICLALAGVYALVAQVSRERSGELSIRTALGARPRHLVNLVTRDVLIAAAIGTVGSIGLSWLAIGLLRPFLFGVSEHPIATWMGVAGGVFVVTFATSWVPARRAALEAWRHPEFKELSRIYR
jgi:ABC-type antimicrobial peptide transport system permease subunit